MHGGGLLTLDQLRRIIAGMFLSAFVAIWIWIAIELLRFNPTAVHPTLVLSTGFATVSGVLSSTVGAGTAAVLGIQVQKFKNEGRGLQAAVGQATTASPLVVVGVLAYSWSAFF
jgi:hypothetical protein